MSLLTSFLMPALLTAGIPAQQAAEDPTRIFARITLEDGTVYEGVVRWGDIEAGWTDLINASRAVPERNLRQRARALGRSWEPQERSVIEVFGRRINLGDAASQNRSEVAIRIGHVRRIEPIARGERALLTLKSGEELELFANTSDLGTRLRDLTIRDATAGSVRVHWSRIDRIDFGTSTGVAAGARRLRGTLVTRDGAEYTGAITWDRDEILDFEELDGEDESGDDHEIAFSQIASIAREGASRARVRLIDGVELVLGGTNDVNRENRGIFISDVGFGQIEIDWADFSEVRFDYSDPPVAYEDFDGGHPLLGVVHTEDGDAIEGRIRWDNDEEYTWEMLDGEFLDSEIAIEFEMINSIEKRSGAGAVVTVRDGRTFEITGSNDVDEDNKGIFVATATGELVLVTWDRFRRVDFRHAHE